jgi:hypothetical protein
VESLTETDTTQTIGPTTIADVHHHILREAPVDLVHALAGSAPWKEIRRDPILRKDWISFTALHWQASEQRLYVGLTAFDTDIFYRFSPETGLFESLSFPGATDDSHQIKIHRGLTPDGAGGFYFGTAGLVDLDERSAARGGAVYHYNGDYTALGIPLPHDYIQHITVDLERGRTYGVTYPLLNFFDFDMRSNQTVYSFFTGSHFHESVVDSSGYVWGTWCARAGHCLFRYHPDERRPEFFHEPIPNLGPEHPFTFPMNGPIDSLIDGEDGFLYFGTTLGELYRVDVSNGQHTLLGRPNDAIRMSGLCLGPGGMLLGSYGAYGQTGLFLYDRQKAAFFDLGQVRNRNAECFMIHDIVWDGAMRVFAAETDNTERSGYLWEVTLA